MKRHLSTACALALVLCAGGGAVADTLGNGAFAVQIDISNSDSVRKAVGEVLARAGLGAAVVRAVVPSLEDVFIDHLAADRANAEPRAESGRWPFWSASPASTDGGVA